MEMELGGMSEDAGQEELGEIYVHSKAESQGINFISDVKIKTRNGK